MKAIGKYGKKWLEVRRCFLDANPPNHQGYYVCYLCHRWILANEITVDHIIARSRSPKLRFEFSNLAVCCSGCNAAKGSRTVKPLNVDYGVDEELEGFW